VLVEINLAVRADDDRALQARAAVAAAASAVSQLRPGATSPHS
jgi:hypothetical protein